MFQKWFPGHSKTKIGFQDVQYAIRQSFVIINTLPVDVQDCLIVRTLSIHLEEQHINEMIDKGIQKPIVLYGMNSTDSTVDTKYDQLVGLGFREIYIYAGGLFEWMLLQDIYGESEFPTTKKVLDLLRFQPNKCVVLQKPR